MYSETPCSADAVRRSHHLLSQITVSEGSRNTEIPKSTPAQSEITVQSGKGECRICLEAEDTILNPLRSPCRCKGNSKYVHLQCLNHWRYQHPAGHPARSRCSVCQTEYQLDLTPRPWSHQQALGWLAYYQRRWFTVTAIYLISSSLLGNWLCSYQMVSNVLTLPEQLQPDSGCMLPFSLVISAWHVWCEYQYVQIRREATLSLPAKLIPSLVSKTIVSLPLVYFLPGGMLIVWSVWTVSLYTRWVWPGLSEISQQDETILDYPS